MEKGKLSPVESGMIRCPECGSRQVRYRSKAMCHMCRRCGRNFGVEITSAGYRLLPLKERG